MKRDTALRISRVTKHQYYYHNKPDSRGRKPSVTTPKLEDDEIIPVRNEDVIQQMAFAAWNIELNPSRIPLLTL